MSASIYIYIHHVNTVVYHKLYHCILYDIKYQIRRCMNDFHGFAHSFSFKISTSTRRLRPVAQLRSHKLEPIILQPKTPRPSSASRTRGSRAVFCLFLFHHVSPDFIVQDFECKNKLIKSQVCCFTQRVFFFFPTPVFQGKKKCHQVFFSHLFLFH